MEYEIIIRPKPIVEFDSIEELEKYLEQRGEDSERRKVKTPYNKLTPEMIEQWKNKN